MTSPTESGEPASPGGNGLRQRCNPWCHPCRLKLSLLEPLYPTPNIPELPSKFHSRFQFQFRGELELPLSRMPHNQRSGHELRLSA